MHCPYCNTHSLQLISIVFCLNRGEPGASRRERQRISIKGVEYIVEEERERTVSVGSRISYYRNGEPMGTAFSDVWAEVSA